MDLSWNWDEKSKGEYDTGKDKKPLKKSLEIWATDIVPPGERVQGPTQIERIKLCEGDAV